MTATPRCRASLGPAKRTGTPSSSTCPLSGRCSPPMIRTTVDLAGMQLEGDLPQRPHGFERLADPAELEQRSDHGAHLAFETFHPSSSREVIRATCASQGPGRLRY